MWVSIECRELRIAQRMRLVFACPETLVEMVHEIGRTEVAHVPLAHDDGRRSGIDQCARQANDTVARDLTEAGGATAERDEIGMQVETEYLADLEPAILPFACAEN